METVRVSEGWRVVIPAAVRAKLKLHQGDQLVCEERDGELVFANKQVRIQRAQALFQQMLPKERANNLVDEFLAERQAEAKKEEKETLSHAKQMEKKRGKSSTRKSNSRTR